MIVDLTQDEKITSSHISTKIIIRKSIVDQDEKLARFLQEQETLEFQRIPNNQTQNDFENQHLISLIQSQEEEEEDKSSFVDIHSLFVQFDSLFFNSKLSSVSVKWSSRMTLCAGLCVYDGGKNSSPEIRLSEPILKFRRKSEIMETLLHEMIHAFLFLYSDNKDHDDHGPQFQKHMERINKDANLKISIYHNFRNEVDYYRTHIWQCQGKCKFILKRAMNRIPSPKDPWWSDHQNKCAGEFFKVSEPIKKEKKRKNSTTTTTTTKSNEQENSNKRMKLEKNSNSTTKQITDYFKSISTNTTTSTSSKK